MRTLALVAALLLLPAAPGAGAQDLPQACRIHVGDQWQDVGVGSATSCLKAIDRWVPAANAQGFKFGSWSGLMLATDAEHFYQSEDEGASWKPVGRKLDLAKATTLAADLDGPVAAGEARPRRTCSLFIDTAWRRNRELTLEECAAELARSPQPVDTQGFRYAYWSGVFLAHGEGVVLRSEDGADWRAVAGIVATAGAAP